MKANLGGSLANITMKELLEAGVHFGHQTKRWNPKMKEYIFGERNGIYIIDLQKTLKMFKEASKFVQEMAAEGKLVLFVGTKRQAQDAIAEEATRCGMFYVNQRWLGGLLTNWVTVQKSVKRLKELDEMATDGRYELLPKKEVVKLERERKHLQANLAGIKNLNRLPDTLFVPSGCSPPRLRTRSSRVPRLPPTSRWQTLPPGCSTARTPRLPLPVRKRARLLRLPGRPASPKKLAWKRSWAKAAGAPLLRIQARKASPLGSNGFSDPRRNAARVFSSCRLLAVSF